MKNQHLERGRQKAEEEIRNALTRANKQMTTIMVDRSMWRDFRIQCIADGRSANATMNDLIADYLERRKQCG